MLKSTSCQITGQCVCVCVWGGGGGGGALCSMVHCRMWPNGTARQAHNRGPVISRETSQILVRGLRQSCWQLWKSSENKFIRSVHQQCRWRRNAWHASWWRWKHRHHVTHPNKDQRRSRLVPREGTWASTTMSRPFMEVAADWENHCNEALQDRELRTVTLWMISEPLMNSQRRLGQS